MCTNNYKNKKNIISTENKGEVAKLVVTVL